MKGLNICEGDRLVEVVLICFRLPSEQIGGRSVYIRPDVEVSRKHPYPKLFRSLRARFYEILRQIAFCTPAGWMILGSIEPEVEAELDTLFHHFEEVKRCAKRKAYRSVEFPRVIYKVRAYFPVSLIYEWLEANIKHAREKLRKLKSRRRIKAWKARLKMLEKQMAYLMLFRERTHR